MFDNFSKREQRIIEILSENNACSIPEISDLLNVSQVTIRSDLSTLEGKGVLLRTRGGARQTYHPDIIARQKTNIGTKQRIARAAAHLIDDGDTIMINNGTTSSLIAKYLLGKRDIHVVTNSTLLLPFARVNPSLHTTLIGGEFSASTEAIIGSQALKQLQIFHVRYVFVGTGGFSLEKGLTTHLPECAEIVRAMAKLGDILVVVADSSKYNKNGFVKILPFEKFDILISDSGLDAEARRFIAKKNVRLILAD